MKLLKIIKIKKISKFFILKIKKMTKLGNKKEYLKDEDYWKDNNIENIKLRNNHICKIKNI